MRTLALALMMVALNAGGARADAGASPKTEVVGMKIRLRVGDVTLTATLLDSKASQDFASLLPLTVTMNDLFRREKYGHLPRAISEDGKRSHSFAVGDVAYWPPARDVAVFHRHDGQSIPEPGIIVLGRIDSGVEALSFPGSRNATIELVK